MDSGRPGATAGPTGLPAVLAVDVGYLMARVARALATREIAALHPLGLSLRSYGVLAVAAEDPRTQIGLAEVTGIDRSSLVALVDELEASGLVRREPVPGDRRARLVTATAAGRELAGRAGAQVRAVEAQALQELPAPAREALLEVLRQLASGSLAAPVDISHVPAPPRRRPSTGRAS